MEWVVYGFILTGLLGGILWRKSWIHEDTADLLRAQYEELRQLRKLDRHEFELTLDAVNQRIEDAMDLNAEYADAVEKHLGIKVEEVYQLGLPDKTTYRVTKVKRNAKV